jgi:hypothetical protein
MVLLIFMAQVVLNFFRKKTEGYLPLAACVNAHPDFSFQKRGEQHDPSHHPD